MAKGDLFKLLQSEPMDQEEKDFRAWLDANKESSFNLAEAIKNEDCIAVGELARQCGWSAEVVHRVLSPHSLRTPRSHISGKVAVEVFQRTHCYEDPSIIERMDEERRAVYLHQKYCLPLWDDLVENFVNGVHIERRKKKAA